MYNIATNKPLFFFLKVVDETLRLVNISFVSFREATKDVFVNGVLNLSRNHLPLSPVITSS